MPATVGIDAPCPNSGGITPVNHAAAEKRRHKGDLRPFGIHPRPIQPPKFVPKFTARPLTFIGRPLTVYSLVASVLE
jgi:hypothetical protein